MLSINTRKVLILSVYMEFALPSSIMVFIVLLNEIATKYKTMTQEPDSALCQLCVQGDVRDFLLLFISDRQKFIESHIIFYRIG